MQPYFAPYIGYISLIKHTDLFILFDPVQFIRHGWIERNRMLKQSGGWLYIQVPLEKFSRETLIKNIKINNSLNWKSKLFAQLVPYNKKAPHYYKVVGLLNTVFEKEYTSIVHLNKALLEAICSYLGFYKELPVFSEMNLPIVQPLAADEWALNICKTLEGEVSYINPIGGLEFFDSNKYEENGISIYFQKMNITSYNQKNEIFESGLSILDVLMFNSVEEVNEMLNQYELI